MVWFVVLHKSHDSERQYLPCGTKAFALETFLFMLFIKKVTVVVCGVSEGINAILHNTAGVVVCGVYEGPDVILTEITTVPVCGLRVLMIFSRMKWPRCFVVLLRARLLFFMRETQCSFVVLIRKLMILFSKE